MGSSVAVLTLTSQSSLGRVHEFKAVPRFQGVTYNRNGAKNGKNLHQ